MVGQCNKEPGCIFISHFDLYNEYKIMSQHTRKTVCSLPQMSHSLGPGRSHQELRSPGSTQTVTSQLSAARPALRPASRGTISLSRAGPYHWSPGGLERRVRC